MTRTDQRFERQFDVLAAQAPALRGPLRALRSAGGRFVRIPLALLLIAGGVFSVLPFLGIWMIPVGLLLLAIDLPFLRGPISALVIRARRRVSVWMRRFRDRRR